MEEIMEETEMKTYAFGWDFGNSESGGVLCKGGQQLTLTNPTAFCRVDTSAMENLGVEVDNKIVIQLQGETSAWAFGAYALTQNGEPWNGQGDLLRYASRYSLRGMLATAGTLVPDKEFGLHVVSGLPAELFIKHPELRKQIKEGLDGSYTFTLDGKVWRTAHIEISTIVMEGAGALIGYPGLGKTSEAGVIDIGGGTTDLYAQVGAAPITDLCKGKSIAVSNATQGVKRAFRQQKQRDLTDKEAREIMYAYASGKKKNFPVISAFGKEVQVAELQDMVEAAIEDVAEDIASFIGQAWKENAARFSPILLIGGGAFYFYEAVQARIAHVVVADDPVFANGKGYATLADRRLKKKNQDAAKAKVEAAAVGAQE
jgi:hypothetical protein